jgi:hypothetical protein
MVKIDINNFWSKDYDKRVDITEHRIVKNKLFNSRQNGNSIKINRQEISYDKLNKLGYYILSLRYVDNNKSDYSIVEKSRASPLKDSKYGDIVILKNCPAFIKIMSERLQKNDYRLEKVVDKYDMEYIKKHEFYFFELIRDEGFKKEVVFKNIYPSL